MAEDDMHLVRIVVCRMLLLCLHCVSLWPGEGTPPQRSKAGLCGQWWFHSTTSCSQTRDEGDGGLPHWEELAITIAILQQSLSSFSSSSFLFLLLQFTIQLHLTPFLVTYAHLIASFWFSSFSAKGGPWPTRWGKVWLGVTLPITVPHTSLPVSYRAQTALHKAAWYGQRSICKMLVDAGASLSRTDYQVFTRRCVRCVVCVGHSCSHSRYCRETRHTWRHKKVVTSSCSNTWEVSSFFSLSSSLSPSLHLPIAIIIISVIITYKGKEEEEKGHNEVGEAVVWQSWFICYISHDPLVTPLLFFLIFIYQSLAMKWA